MANVSVFSDHKDIPEILQINALNFVTKQDLNDGKANPLQGFLLGKLDSEYLKKISANKNHIILVAKENNKIVGYLTAHNIIEARLSKGCIEKILEINKNKKAANNILYYHQIAKLPNTKSIGKEMLSKMLNLAKLNYNSIFCKIVHTPRNEASIKFHTKFGFAEVGQIEEDGVVYGIYYKAISDLLSQG